MVHVQPTNEKLVIRATNMIAAITKAEKETALKALQNANMHVPDAIIMLEGNCDSRAAARALDQAGGNVRKAIELVK